MYSSLVTCIPIVIIQKKLSENPGKLFNLINYYSLLLRATRLIKQCESFCDTL